MTEGELENRLFILGFTSDGIKRIEYTAHSLNYDGDNVLRVILPYSHKHSLTIIELFWGPRRYKRQYQAFVISEIDQMYDKILEILDDSK